MISRLLLLLLAATVEAVPLALLASLLDAWDTTHPNNGGLSPVPLAIAVLLSYVVSRELLRRDVGERAARATLVVAAVVVAPPLLLGTRTLDLVTRPMSVLDASFVIGIAAVLFAWSRGTILERDDVTLNIFDSVYSGFRRGVVMLAASLALAAATGGAAGSRLIAAGWGSVVAFFVAGLCALSLARIEEERRRGAGPDGAPPVRGEWVMTLLGVTAVVLVIGLGLAILVSPAAVAALTAALNRAADLIVALLTPVIYLLFAIMEPILRWIFALLPHQKQRPNTTARGGQTDPLRALRMNGHAAQITHGVVIALVVAAALIAVWYAFAHRRAARDERDGDEVRESLWSWSLLGAALSHLLARLRGLFSRRHGDAEAAPDSLAVPAPIDRRSVRALYRRLLRRMALLGHARAPAETPQEYLGRLRRVVDDERDVTLLTMAYMRVRYGDEPETADDTERAAVAIERLERTLPPSPPSRAD